MKKGWKKILKRIGVFALAVTLSIETLAGNVVPVKAAENGNHVYVETYLDGVLEGTQDLGVKNNWVQIPLGRENYSVSEIWINDVKQSGVWDCGFDMSGKTSDVTVKLYYVAKGNEGQETAGNHTITFFDLQGNSATEAPINVKHNQCLKASQVPDTLKDNTVIITGWKLTGGANEEFGWVMYQVYTKEQILELEVVTDLTFQAVGTGSGTTPETEEYTVIANAVDDKFADGKFADGTTVKTYAHIAVGTDPVLDTPYIATVEEGGVRITYRFVHWEYADESGKTVNPKKVPAGTVVYATAKFVTNPETLYYMVEVDRDNGSEKETMQVQVTQTPALTNPTKAATTIGGVKTEYTFTGWKYTVDGKEITDLTTVTEGTKVVATAQYSENTTTFYYYVNVKDDDGTLLVEQPLRVQVSKHPAITTIPTKASVTDEVNGTKTTYTFADWKYEDEAGNTVVPVKTEADNTINAIATYTSETKAIYYNLIVKDKDGEVAKTEQVVVGKTPNLEAPANYQVTENGETKEYIFKEWKYTDEAGKPVDPTKVPEGSKVIATPDYDVKTLVYTVKYDAAEGTFADGSKNIDREVAIGNAPASVEAPTREKTTNADGIDTTYEFAGWTYTYNGTEVADFLTLPADAVVLAKASYDATEQSYKVTVKYNNGTVDAHYVVAVGEDFAPEYEPKKGTEVDPVTGFKITYKFAGWSYKYADGTVAVPVKAKADDEIFVIASYMATVQKYTVIYNTNGGSFPDADAPTTVEAAVGSTPAEVPNPVKPDGFDKFEGFATKYFFDKWVYTDKDGNEVTDLTKVPAGEIITATAFYTEEEQAYQLYIDAQNGDAVQGPSKAKVGNDITLGTPAKKATEADGVRTSYTFKEWTYADTEGNVYEKLADVPAGKVVTATAHYSETKTDITYTVIVDQKNGEDPEEKTVIIGKEPELPTPTKPSEEKDGERIDYEFKEWEYRDKDGNPVDPKEVEEGEEITATATYEEKKTDLHYTVKVDEANGKDAYEETVKVGTTPNLGTPEKAETTDGNQKTTYTFDKWVYTDKDGNEVTDLTKVGKEEEITATATYTSETETITTPETPNPDPDPTPDPEPNPNPTPDPEPQPQPDPTPNPQPQPEPAPQPAPNPEPGPQPQPAPEPQPVPEPQPAPAPQPEPVVNEPVAEDTVVIEEEDTPLADAIGNDKAQEVVSIEDEETPLAAEMKEDGCFIHWIILLLSAAYLIFAGYRIADRKKRIEEIEEKQKEQEAQVWEGEANR